MSNAQKRHKRKSNSKRRKLKSYQQHYECSMNNLIQDFETNLDISPILSNKTESRTKYQSEEKEPEIPNFTLTLSLETDDIPRIQELQHHEIYGNTTESDMNELAPYNPTESMSKENMTKTEIHQNNVNNSTSSKQEEEMESDCNVSNSSKQHESIQQNTTKPSIINNDESIHQFPQLPPQQNISPHDQHIQNISDHHNNLIPNTPQLSQTMQYVQQQPIYHQFSQSYDFAVHHNRYNNNNNNNNHNQHHFTWNQPQPQHQNRYQNHIQHQQQQQQQQHNTQQWMQMSHNNIPNMSHFGPQKLLFPSNTSSLINTNTSTVNNCQQPSPPHSSMDEMKEMKEIKEMKENSNINLDDIDVEEDDSNLFMPITPTLSGSALRALLSHLRRKCKTLEFKCKQQTKFIVDQRHQISDIQTNLSNDKLKIYDHEQNILMLQNQDDMNSLEYLRGAELHQTRQELTYLMQKMNELQRNNNHLKQQIKLQQLDNESYNKSLKQEYERLLREINQHKVLFDQRGREIKQLKESSDAEKIQFDKTLDETTKIKQEKMNKLEIMSEQLLSLRNNHENLKKKYDEIYSENDTLKKSIKDIHLEIDEKDQNILSLQRVRDNLEQEIEALSRTNRNFREIRNKSTSQLLESQQYEIDSMKQQIIQKYDKYLEEEKIKSDKLQQLLQEKNMEINQLQNCRMHIFQNENENDDFRKALERLEIENHELRKKLEEIQFDDMNNNDTICINKYIQTDNEITKHNNDSIMDPYQCPSSTTSSMDEFGIMMLKAAKEEVEQLRKTNEKLMKLHAKNHLKKPRMQDECTQTYDNMNHTETSTSANSSFITVGSVQTQKYFDNFNQSPIPNKDNFEIFPSSPEKSDKVLINDTSIVTTADNSFIKEFHQDTKC